MAYPPLLELTDSQRTRIMAHLRQIALDHKAERQAFVEDLTQWQKEYWAKPVTQRKKFPFDGASVLIIPITAITFETVHARTMTTAFGLEQAISVKVVDPAFSDYGPPIERFVKYELDRMCFEDKIENSIIELEKFGTGVAKCRYETVTKKGIFYQEGVKQEFTVTTRRGAVVDAVPLAKFHFPFDVANYEDADWLGEEFDKTHPEVEQLERDGLFYPGSSLATKYWFNGLVNPFQESQERLQNQTPTMRRTLPLIEYWFSFPLEEGGDNIELVAHFSYEANALLSCRANWYSDLRKPYRVGKYFPVEHRMCGVGIAKQCEAFQREITTIHRQRLDNATLANMRMWVVNRMSGIQPGEPIYPGKVWFVNDKDQIQGLQAGEVYSSAFNVEHMTLMYAQQRSGVNEVNLGMPQSGTPGTATDSLMRVQEGNRKFDYCYRNVKKFLNGMAHDVLCTVQQFGPRTVEYFDHAENGQMVQEFLSLPENLIKDQLIIELFTAGQNHNRVLDRDNWQKIAALLTQYYTGLRTMAMEMGDMNMVQLITTKIYTAGTIAMKQILESYDVRNVDRMILTEVLNGVPKPAGNGQAQAPRQDGLLADPAQVMQLLGAGGR